MDRAPGRALLIDDDAPGRDALADLLSVLGYQTTTAGDGAEGLARFQAGDYDLVVTALRTPGMTGWDVAAHIRGQNAGIPIIVTAGSVADVDARRADALRLIVLGEPFAFDELRTARNQAAALTMPDRLRRPAATGTTPPSAELQDRPLAAPPEAAAPESGAPSSSAAREASGGAATGEEASAVLMDESRAIALALERLARRAEAVAVQHERLQGRVNALQHLEAELRRLTDTLDRVSHELVELHESHRLLRQERDSLVQAAARERSVLAEQLQALVDRLIRP